MILFEIQSSQLRVKQDLYTLAEKSCLQVAIVLEDKPSQNFHTLH